jgi:hypothetical protein
MNSQVTFATHPEINTLVMTFNGKLSGADILEQSKGAAPFLMEFVARQSTPKPILILIIDTINTESNFADMMQLLRRQDEIDDSNLPVTTIMVGSAAMAKFYVDMRRLQQYGGENIPLFQSLDDALNAAREMHARLSTTQPSVQ